MAVPKGGDEGQAQDNATHATLRFRRGGPPTRFQATRRSRRMGHRRRGRTNAPSVPRQRALEAERLAMHGEGVELLGRPVAQHRVVVRAGLQVLADRDHVDRMFTQIVQRAMNLVEGLAETEHDAGLGRHARMPGLEAPQQVQRPGVVGAGAHFPVEVGHGLDVVVEDVGRMRGKRIERAFHAALAAEVGGEDLDADAGVPKAPPDAGGEMRGAAIGEVVGRPRCEHTQRRRMSVVPASLAGSSGSGLSGAGRRRRTSAQHISLRIMKVAALCRSTVMFAGRFLADRPGGSRSFASTGRRRCRAGCARGSMTACAGSARVAVQHCARLVRLLLVADHGQRDGAVSFMRRRLRR